MITDYYTQTIIIKRDTETLDAAGKLNKSTATISTVSGIIEDASGDLYLKNEKRTYITTHIAYMNITDVQEHDILVESSKEYRVHNVENPLMRNHHLELNVEFIK